MLEAAGLCLWHEFVHRSLRKIIIQQCLRPCSANGASLSSHLGIFASQDPTTHVREAELSFGRNRSGSTTLTLRSRSLDIWNFYTFSMFVCLSSVRLLPSVRPDDRLFCLSVRSGCTDVPVHACAHVYKFRQMQACIRDFQI